LARLRALELSVRRAASAVGSKKFDTRSDSLCPKRVRRFCSISGIDNANHQSIGSQRPRFGNDEEQVAGLAGLPAASRRVHACVHDDAEEAELGTS
jgi:hypothetical protein